MCLVLLAFQCHPDVNVLLAGNRDELKSRPSAPPAMISAEPPIYAGRDLEAGGSWMGRNGYGLMAALTNRRGTRAASPEARSRGGIVMELLRHSRPEAAAAWLAEEPIGLYRPFSMLFGDRERFYFFSSEETAPPRPLAPGFYALSNSSLDDRDWPKVDRSHLFFRRHRHLDGERLIRELQIFLGDATPPDNLTSPDRNEEIHGVLGAVFIRNPEYGTVSSTILTAGGSLGERYYFAEGSDLEKGPTTSFKIISFAGLAGGIP